MKITAFDPNHPYRLGTGTTLGSSAGGDLSGSLPAPTVSGLQGTSVTSNLPANVGDVLTISQVSPPQAIWATPSNSGNSGTSADVWDEAATNGTFEVRVLTAASAGGMLNAAYDATVGKTFLGYSRGDNGDICIREYDHRTRVLGAEVVLNSALGPDTHNTPDILVRADGYISVVYSDHNGSAVYQRVSTNTHDVSAFGTETNLDSQLGGTTYTYPRQVQIGDGTVYLFVRPVAGAAGQNWAYATSPDGGVSSWSALTSYFAVAGRYSYVLKIARNGDDRIDFFGQNGSVNVDADVDVFHFYHVPSAGTWHKSDGTSAGSLPLDDTDATQVYDGTTNSAHTASIAIEPHTGYPIVAFKVYQSDGTTDIRYRWGRWSGSAWSTIEVADNGEFASYQPGDIVLDQGRPNRLYCSRDTSGTMQIWQYETLDRGATFEAGVQLTTGADDAILPCSPDDRGPGLPVLFPVGSWTDATTYAQGISAYAATDDAAGSSSVSPLTTKGDLYTYDTADARLAVGSNGTGIVADGAETVGMRWTLQAIRGELLMQDGVTAPPVPIETELRDDWLYADL